MQIVKMVILGQPGSGKSQIMNCVIRNMPFGENHAYAYNPKIDIKSRQLGNILLSVYDLHDVNTDSFYYDAEILAYCINVSEIFTNDFITKIVSDIELINKTNPKGTIILVGTLFDKLMLEENALSKLATIRANLLEKGITVDEEHCVLTSSKTGYGIRNTLDLLSSAAESKIPVKHRTLETTEDKTHTTVSSVTLPMSDSATESSRDSVSSRLDDIEIIPTETDTQQSQPSSKPLVAITELSPVLTVQQATDDSKLDLSSDPTSASTGQETPTRNQSAGHEDTELTEELPWEHAVNELYSALSVLPANKRQAIIQELETLRAVLLTINNDDKNTAIPAAFDALILKCEDILEDKHPNIMRILLKIAAVAAVALITAAVGFTLGVFSGAWMGPGAFIAGVMTGSTAAVAVVATTGLATGLSAYSLFKRDSAKPEDIVSVNRAISTFAHNLEPSYLGI